MVDHNKFVLFLSLSESRSIERLHDFLIRQERSTELLSGDPKAVRVLSSVLLRRARPIDPGRRVCQVPELSSVL